MQAALRLKSPKMFNITTEDVKRSIYNTSSDLIDYKSKSEYPYGTDITIPRKDIHHYVFSTKDGKFIINKCMGEYADDLDDKEFVTCDVIDFYTPQYLMGNENRRDVNVGRLYLDKSVKGTLIYLKKSVMIGMEKQNDGSRLVTYKSYNGPALIQGKRFFLCNGTIWNLVFKIKSNNERTLVSKTCESPHTYGWGYVINNTRNGGE